MCVIMQSMFCTVIHAPLRSSACGDDFNTFFRLIELAQRSIEFWRGLHQWAVLWTVVVLRGVTRSQVLHFHSNTIPKQCWLR